MRRWLSWWHYLWADRVVFSENLVPLRFISWVSDRRTDLDKFGWAVKCIEWAGVTLRYIADYCRGRVFALVLFLLLILRLIGFLCSIELTYTVLLVYLLQSQQGNIVVKNYSKIKTMITAILYLAITSWKILIFVKIVRKGISFIFCVSCAFSIWLAFSCYSFSVVLVMSASCFFASIALTVLDVLPPAKCIDCCGENFLRIDCSNYELRASLEFELSSIAEDHC